MAGEKKEISGFSFCVVIPMYNEERGAEQCIRSVCTALAACPHRNLLLVVDDGSADATGKILQRLAPEFQALTVVTHEKNSGYGAALRTGIKAASNKKFTYVLFMDSDLTNDPADIPRFTKKMAEQFDVIKATRYSDGGAMQGIPAQRYWISRIGNEIARMLLRLPVTDCTNGFRAVRVSLLEQVSLRENNFSIIMEELFYMKYLASSFANVPVILKNRSGDQRKTSFRYTPSIFYDYLKYPLRSYFNGNPFSRQGNTSW